MIQVVACASQEVATEKGFASETVLTVRRGDGQTMNIAVSEEMHREFLRFSEWGTVWTAKPEPEPVQAFGLGESADEPEDEPPVPEVSDEGDWMTGLGEP